MKKACVMIFLGMLAVFLSVFGSASGEESGRRLTVMVYMCGSNLESQYGSASSDIREMVETGDVGRDVSVLVMTGGSRMDNSPGYFQSDSTAVYEIGMGRIRSIWNSPEPMNMGDPATLTELIRFARENRPAEKYALILWDHGGGPLEGVCWDELFSMDHLSLQELLGALEDAGMPQKLSWIGFDACLMGSAEVALALSPYAEYMIASQEREPADGWNYAFLKGIGADSSGAETGKRIIDTYVDTLETEPNDLTLSCVDLARMQQIIPAMDAFFSNVSSAVSLDTYSDLSFLRMDSVGFGKAVRGQDDGALDLVDLQDLVRKMGKNGNESRLLSLLQEAVVYSRGTIPGATGLSVYHPFSNKKNYIGQWKEEYAALQFSSRYQDYIDRFGKILTSGDIADWSGLKPDSFLSESSGEQVFSLQLTEMQRKTFARGRLMILAAYDLQNGIYGVVGARSDESQTLYTPVSVSSAQLKPDGQLTAVYNTQTLYATDENGAPVCGPLTYELSDNGEICYVHGCYSDRSGRENSAEDLPVLFSFRTAPSGGALERTGVMGYDPVSGTYTPRVPVREDEYTLLSFRTRAGMMPAQEDSMPGFEEWESSESDQGQFVDLPARWQLRFFDTQMSAVQLYAVFQITDNQQNTHSSQPVLITNPNLEAVQIQPRVTENSNYRIRFFLIRDASPLNPGLNLAVEVTNLSHWTTGYLFDRIVINQTQSMISPDCSSIHIKDLEPDRTRTEIIHLDGTALTNLGSLDEISLTLHLSSESHQYSKDTLKVRFKVDQCSLNGIAGQAGTVLGRAAANGMTWELVRLERNSAEDFDAVLRITNESDETHSLNFRCAANGILSDQDSIGVEIPAGAAGYTSFRIPDQCILEKDFRAGGKTVRYTLNAAGLLERHGETELRSLQLIPASEDAGGSRVTIPLEPAVPLAGSAENEAEAKLLMSGKAEVYLERVFLADNGLGMRMTFINPTDSDLRISCDRVTFNERDIRDPDRDNVLIVPAGGKAVHCIGITDETNSDGEERLERVGIVLRVNEFCAAEAVIRLHQEAEDHRYLSGSEYDVIPAVYEPPELRFLSDSAMQHFHFSMQVSGGVANGRGLYQGTAAEGETTYLSFSARITNLSYTAREFSFTNLRLNGNRLTDRRWETVSVNPGETRTVKVYIPAVQLQDLEEIHEISCEMSSYAPDNIILDNQVSLSFTMEKTFLSPLIPEMTPLLAKAENADMEWQLLGIREDDAGRITAWLRMINRSPDRKSGLSFATYLNGYRIADTETPLLSPGQDLILEVKGENRVIVAPESVSVYRKDTGCLLEDHLLERRGISAVSDVRILWQDHGESGEIILNPEHPVQLADVPATAEEECLRILESPVLILVNHVLVGEKDVAVSIDLVNRSEEPVRLNAGSPAVNGESCGFGEDYAYTLPPLSRRTDTLILTRDEQQSLLVRGDSVQDVSFTWNCLNSADAPASLLEVFASVAGGYRSVPVTFTLLHEAPFGAHGGRVLAGNELGMNVNKAELLLRNYPMMDAETVSPVELIPALDPKQAEAFAGGETSVYLRIEGAYRNRVVETDGDGYDEYLPVLRRIFTTGLARDNGGRILSNYSGLAWVDTQGQPLAGVELSKLNSEFADTLLAQFADDSGNGDGLRIEMRLPVWVFRDGTAYREYRAGKRKTVPEYDYILFGVNDVDLSGPVPENLLQYQGIFSRDYSEVIDPASLAGENLLCVQMEDEIILKNGEPLKTNTGEKQVVCMGDLRLVRADELEGTLVVRYDLRYQDGSRETIYENYPYGF